MKKPCGLLLAAMIFVLASSADAQEPPEKQLEFVRKLRDKGYADLALEYLENLHKNAAPELKQFLSMELARTRIVLARDKGPEQRLALIKAAREEMAAFIKANPDRPESAQARLELARLATQEGKALLSKALRQEDSKAQQDEARKAEAQFMQAGQELDAAAKLLEALAANYKDKNPEQEKRIKEQLAQDGLQARLDRALNLMEQASTYLDISKEDLNTKKATLIDEARKIFEKLIEGDADNPVCLLAAAWLVRCSQEAQDFGLADRYLELVLKQKIQAADPAKRLARYFHLQGILNDKRTPKSTSKKTTQAQLEKKRLQEIQAEALYWLKLYPSYRNSPEGYGVRFELANAYLREAQLVSKDPKSIKAAAFYKKAKTEFAALAESDSDFSEKANQINLGISFLRMGKDTPVAKLKDFEECFLKGNYELFEIKKAAAVMGKGREKERAARLQTVIEAFSTALAKADSKTAPHKLDEAGFFLMTAYLLSGDAAKAVEVGEPLARQVPPRKRSAAAAAYVLEALAVLLKKQSSDENRDRFLKLANFILKDRNKYWQGEPVTPLTRYQLAMLYKSDENFKEAIAQLEALSPDYVGFTFAQGQLVFIALQARNKAQADMDKKFFLDKALAALKRIPQLPVNPDPVTAAMFFAAQMEYSKWLFGEGALHLAKGDTANAAVKFKDMAVFNKQLQGQFAKLPIQFDSNTSQKMAFSMQVLEKLNRFGLTDIEYRAGNYDRVLAGDMAGGVVAEIAKRGQAPGPVRLNDFDVTGRILGLALRANVQKGKIEDAKAILQLLGRLTGPDEDQTGDSSGVVRSLIQELEQQVAALKKAGDAGKLKSTVANFSTFVDELAKSQKNPQPTDYFLLGRIYDTLDQHCKAALMYGKIPQPKSLNAKKLTDNEDKEVQTYWYAQIQYARQLRQCPEKKDDNFKIATKALADLLKHPNGRGHLMADKEMIHLIQDRGLYGAAITRWGKFLNNPVLTKALDVEQNKEMLFDAYYENVYCTYKFSQEAKVKMAGKEKLYLRRAANLILQLENTKNPNDAKLPGDGWKMIGPRLQELMQDESASALRKQYEDLKKGKKTK